MKNIKLAEKIRNLRKKAGFTQEKLAEYLDVNAITVSRWENGVDIPKTFKIKKMAEIFNCTETELLNDSETEEGKIKITISYDWNKMKEANIDMFSENFDLIVGANGAIGIKGAGTMTSREAINDFIERIKEYLETGFEAQEKLKKEEK